MYPVNLIPKSNPEKRTRQNLTLKHYPDKRSRLTLASKSNPEKRTRQNLTLKHYPKKRSHLTLTPKRISPKHTSRNLDKKRNRRVRAPGLFREFRTASIFAHPTLGRRAFPSFVVCLKWAEVSGLRRGRAA